MSDLGETQEAAAGAHSRYLVRTTQEMAAESFREMDKLHQQNAQLRQQVEQQAETIADLKAQHASNQTEWESKLARCTCQSDSKLFKYTVRGSEAPPLSGCVPKQIFQAEPDSALAQIYDGKWEYTTDDQGRAVINSNPANWPIILDWLSFGCVPKDPQDLNGLIAECQYWQLTRLLAALQVTSNGEDIAAPAATHHLSSERFEMGGHVGFKVTGLIYDFPSRLQAATASDEAQLLLPFNAAGRKWALQISKMGIYVQMQTGNAITKASMRLVLGPSSHAFSMASNTSRIMSAAHSRGWKWKADNVAQLMHPKMIEKDGSIKVLVTLTFSS